MIAVQEGQIIAGKYRLKHPLAKGGMGAVWAANHVTLDVPVAVKFMDPQYTNVDELRSRFEREAKAAAQLRMPNVVQVLDYGVEEGTPYIVMEFLIGEDLGARLACESRLSLRDTVAILTQIGKVLRRAHEEGIVHRDLKPANVFLVKHDDELLVKILDFGIAKVIRQDTTIGPIGEGTKTGAVMGSPHYMSPEQVRGLKEVDHRSDLWSVGVITYRMLTGRVPFPGTQLGDVFLKICTERPISPTQIVEDLDIRVDALISKALAVNPAERFQNAKEMIDALARLTVDMSPEAITPQRPADPLVDPIEPKTSPSKLAPTAEKMTTPREQLPEVGHRATELSTPPSQTATRPTLPADEMATNAPVTQQINRGSNAIIPLSVSNQKPFVLAISGSAAVSLVIAVGLYVSYASSSWINTPADSLPSKMTAQTTSASTTPQILPVAEAQTLPPQVSAAPSLLVTLSSKSPEWASSTSLTSSTRKPDKAPTIKTTTKPETTSIKPKPASTPTSGGGLFGIGG